MALTSAYDTIAAAMLAAFPTLQTGLGQRALDAAGSYPRMVWVPTRDTLTAPTRDRALQRSLRTCETSVVVFLWGETIAAVEDMRERLLTELQAAAPGAWDVSTGEWAGPGVTTAGEQLALTIALRFSQHELPAPTTVTITAVAPDTTGAAPADGNLDAGETTL